MTCATLPTFPEDLKPLLNEGMGKLCPIGIVPREYETLQFYLSPGKTRSTRPLPPCRPVHALGGAYAPPGCSVFLAGLPRGGHATGTAVARATISSCVCSGYHGYAERLPHAWGGGHLPQRPLPPKTPARQKGERIEMGNHLSHIRCKSAQYDDVWKRDRLE